MTPITSICLTSLSKSPRYCTCFCLDALAETRLARALEKKYTKSYLNPLSITSLS